MKRITLILMLALAAFACNKEKSPSDSPSQPKDLGTVAGGTVASITTGAWFQPKDRDVPEAYAMDVVTYEYDSKGRISKMIMEASEDEYLYGWSQLRGLRKSAVLDYTFTYDEANFTAHESGYQTFYDKNTGELKPDTRFQTSSWDMVFDGSWSKIKGEVIAAPFADYGNYMEYGYYDDGHLKACREGFGPSDYTDYTYTWKNGDIVKVEIGTESVVEIEYYSTENPIPFDHKRISGAYCSRYIGGFAGPLCKHIAKQEKSTYTNPETGEVKVTIYKFLYEKDSQNRITKITSKEWDSENKKFYPDSRNFWTVEFEYK